MSSRMNFRERRSTTDFAIVIAVLIWVIAASFAFGLLWGMMK